MIAGCNIFVWCPQSGGCDNGAGILVPSDVCVLKTQVIGATVNVWARGPSTTFTSGACYPGMRSPLYLSLPIPFPYLKFLAEIYVCMGQQLEHHGLCPSLAAGPPPPVVLPPPPVILPPPPVVLPPPPVITPPPVVAAAPPPVVIPPPPVRTPPPAVAAAPPPVIMPPPVVVTVPQSLTGAPTPAASPGSHSPCTSAAAHTSPAVIGCQYWLAAQALPHSWSAALCKTILTAYSFTFLMA